MTDFQEKRNPDRNDSVEVNRNSKGYTWSIKRYYNHTEETDDDVLERIKYIDGVLRRTYE